jgi:two-component system, LytTR family, sensor kinase
VATHLFRIVFFVFRWDSLSLVSLLPRVLLVVALLSVGEAWLISALHPIIRHTLVNAPLAVEPSHRLHLPRAANSRLLRFWVEFAKCVLVLLTWAAFFLGNRLQQILKSVQLDRLRLDAAVKEAELKALRSQVNPHFLFNSLNTIRSLIEEDRLKAREAVTRLAELFRASLRSSEVDTVALRTELHTVNAYLALEKLRFEERLQIHLQVDPEALNLSIPPFLLQTLIENAFKHGIYPQSAGGTITCTIQAPANGLRLTVTNPGQLPAEEKYRESGIGNARARLKLIYGPEASLEITQGKEQRVTVQVFLPQAKAVTANSSNSKYESANHR